jgi:UPF0716 family protein affecting phage T7 exclusion
MKPRNIFLITWLPIEWIIAVLVWSKFGILWGLLLVLYTFTVAMRGIALQKNKGISPLTILKETFGDR